jgi:methyl-accepting chemotaxis protein
MRKLRRAKTVGGQDINSAWQMADKEGVHLARGTLGQRVGAACALVVTAALVSQAYFITKGYSKDIAVAELEQRGSRYQRELEGVLEGLLELRQQGGGTAAARQATVDQINTRVEVAFSRLRAAHEELAGELELTGEGLASRKREHLRLENVEREWAALHGATDGVDHLIEDVRGLVAHVGDTSHLVLDPDLDSYYLMDATVVALPQAQVRLAAIEVLAREWAGRGAESVNVQIRFGVLAALVREADAARVAADLSAALDEDAKFYGVSPSLKAGLAAPEEEYTRRNQQLLGALDQIAAGDDTVEAASAVVQAAQAVRRASFQLWRAAEGELAALLEQRKAELAWERMWAYVLALASLALSAVLAATVIRSVSALLRALAARVLMQSQELVAASNQIAAGAAELANASSEQAAALEQTSASGEQVRAMTVKNASDLRRAAAVVIESERKFTQASQSLAQLVISMDEINQQSGRISKIIHNIDEIAFQTNILALNAAVEAARAGEAGMGFAVVADEVRNLAQRCALAAQDTAKLIEESVAKADRGKLEVDRVAAEVIAIGQESTRVRRLVEQVAADSADQTQGMEQISKAMTFMGSTTQTTAASAEESAAAASLLKAQCGSSQEIAHELEALVGSARAA